MHCQTSKLHPARTPRCGELVAELYLVARIRQASASANPARGSTTNPASLSNRAAALLITEDLPRSLWLGWSRFDLLALGIMFWAGLFARCDRLFLLNFHALIIVVNAVAGTTRKLDAI